MIELGHIAVGALTGCTLDGPVSAFVAGMATHALLDVAPHAEIDDTMWELWSTAVGVVALAARFGWKSPIVWGAIGGVLPDAEHVLPRAVRPRHALFPSHNIDVLHSENPELAVPAWVQVVVGAAVVGALIFGSRRGGAQVAT